jgi:MFS family permease
LKGRLETYSWNEIYRYFAVFGFGLCLLSLVIVKTPETYRFVSTISLREALWRVIRNRQIWLCSGTLAMSFGIILAYGGLWYMPVQEYYAVNKNTAVLIGSMIFLGVGVGTPLLGWLSNYFQSRKLIVHITLILGNMGLLMAIYLPHFDIKSYFIIEIVSFFTGFFLSGSMLIYTMVSEMSDNNTRGIALSIANTSVFLSNALFLLIPYLFTTVTSTSFFTFLWVLPFCVMISILLIYFIEDTYYRDVENNLRK